LGLEPELEQEQLVRTSAPLVLALRVVLAFVQQAVTPVVIQAAVLVQQVARSQVEVPQEQVPQEQVLSLDCASEEALVPQRQTVVVAAE
jgi:hypothetical protein